MKHKIVPENCEFLLDSENRIYGISFKLTERKSETYYMIQNNFFGSIIRRLYKMQPFYIYYNKKKFCQTYEISKEFDLNYIIPYNNYKLSICCHRSAPLNKKQYICIFCVMFLKNTTKF